MRAVLIALLIVGCGPSEPAEAPVKKETPEMRVQRVGTQWTSLLRTRGSEHAGSPVDTYQQDWRFVLQLGEAGKGSEQISVTEDFSMRDKSRFQCHVAAEREVRLDFDWLGNDPRLTLSEPALALDRVCQPAGFPDPRLTLPAKKNRFVLQGDELKPLDSGERRVFLPSF